MQGCIQKRGGTYYIRVDLGRVSNGKRIQKYKGGFKKKREAQEYLSNLLLEVKKGDYLESSQEDFNDYLLKWFHSSYKRSEQQQIPDGVLLKSILSLTLKGFRSIRLLQVCWMNSIMTS